MHGEPNKIKFRIHLKYIKSVTSKKPTKPIFIKSRIRRGNNTYFAFICPQGKLLKTMATK